MNKVKMLVLGALVAAGLVVGLPTGKANAADKTDNLVQVQDGTYVFGPYYTRARAIEVMYDLIANDGFSQGRVVFTDGAYWVVAW
jgi:hypothetical protein